MDIEGLPQPPQAALTMDELAVDPDLVDLHALLSGWEPVLGLPAERMLPMLVSVLGDAFVQNLDDGSVAFLDATAGRLEAVCDSAEALHELLEDPDFIAYWFDPDAVLALRASGLQLQAGELYCLRVGTAEGGEWRPDNVIALPVAEAFARRAVAARG